MRPSDAFQSAIDLLFGEEVFRSVEFIKKQANDPNSPKVKIFLTWEDLGIFALNHLGANDIYAIGLVGGSKNAHSQEMTSADFFRHDAGHASYNISLKRLGISEFYHQLNYDLIRERLSESNRVLFDLGYFLYFREGVGTKGWETEAAQLPENPKLADLQAIYQRIFFQFNLTFEGESVTSHYINYPFNYSAALQGRFLDREDLRPHLPLEIKQALQANPAASESTVMNFIDEIFTVFFQVHYLLAQEIFQAR